MQRFLTISDSPETTEEIGATIAKILRKGDIISISGELGAGKTCLIRGMVVALGGGQNVTSASFTLLSRYDASIPIYHFDAYRLEDSAQALHLGLDDYIFGDGITIIEWGDRISDILPDECLFIEIEYLGDEARRITLLSDSKKWQDRLSELGRSWKR
ncbi:MAG: tRNA (adenosine(37)-N6)-threonylcarbamoyltransferase complex ATPase subunit type 1 TsaE [Actinobacteria bacterium]|nr:tRNA (adenosine(37)-N6)-threonylcarbamoyltransferase complex ATPase subunit type 1 TsaE [Actinomycetota bacterium]